MCALIQDYFMNLFSSEVMEVNPEVLMDVRRQILPEMNREFLAPYSYEELKNALFNIGDLKASGPDGLHVIFYKRFWPMLGGDPVKEVLEAVNMAMIPEVIFYKCLTRSFPDCLTITTYSHGPTAHATPPARSANTVRTLR